MNFSGLHISVSKCLIELMVISCIDQFEMCSRDVFWMLLNSSELNVIYFEKLFNYSHNKADFIITQLIKNHRWR